ncbi:MULTISPECIES: DsbA family protein [Edwardsiella]
MDQIKKEIAQRRDTLTFKNMAEFDTAVEASVNRFIMKKQQDEVKSKFALFSSAPEKTDGKHIYGDMDARFTLVEFSDLECGYCKQFHDTPKKIVDSSKGNVNWQWKHMPLDFHNPAAYKQAVAAECIAEQKGNRGFWVFLSDVFEHTQGNGRGVQDLAALVSGVGADINVFRACLASGKYDEQVKADIQKAKENGVNGTPATFVVDNITGHTQLLGGAQPPQAIMAVMRKMMVESQQEDDGASNNQ